MMATFFFFWLIWPTLNEQLDGLTSLKTLAWIKFFLSRLMKIDLHLVLHISFDNSVGKPVFLVSTSVPDHGDIPYLCLDGNNKCRNHVEGWPFGRDVERGVLRKCGHSGREVKWSSLTDDESYLSFLFFFFGFFFLLISPALLCFDRIYVGRQGNNLIPPATETLTQWRF